MGDIGEGVLGAERGIGTVFDFEDGGGLEDLDGVPLVARDVDAVVAGGGVEEVALGGTARLIAEDDVHAAAQEDVGLGGGVMAVDGEDRAREEDVDEALGFGIKALVEVEVHAQPRRLCGLGGDGVEEFVVDVHACNALDLRYSACR